MFHQSEVGYFDGFLILGLEMATKFITHNSGRALRARIVVYNVYQTRLNMGTG